LYSLVCMVVGLQCFIHTVSKLEFSFGLPVLELNIMQIPEQIILSRKMKIKIKMVYKDGV